jgi:hypothetical protein
MANPSCPICEDPLAYSEGEYGEGGHQSIFWICKCGFREQVRCPKCHELMTLYLRNGFGELPSPGFLCLCGFYVVPEVCS